MPRETPEPPTIPEFGEWVASCGPGETVSTFSRIIQYGSLVIGVASFFVPMFIPPRPGEEGGVWLLFGGLGVLLLGIGFLMVVVNVFFYDKTVVHMYREGISLMRPKGTAVNIPFSKMQSIKIVTIWEDRFNSYQKVELEPEKGRAGLFFTTKLIGDSEEIAEVVEARAVHVEHETISMG